MLILFTANVRPPKDVDFVEMTTVISFYVLPHKENCLLTVPFFMDGHQAHSLGNHTHQILLGVHTSELTAGDASRSHRHASVHLYSYCGQSGLS